MFVGFLGRGFRAGLCRREEEDRWRLCLYCGVDGIGVWIGGCYGDGNIIK